MSMSNRILPDYRKIIPRKKLSEPIQSPKFVSHRARISGEFDSTKNSHSRKFERRRRILCDSKLYGLHPFDNMAIIH